VIVHPQGVAFDLLSQEVQAVEAHTTLIPNAIDESLRIDARAIRSDGEPTMVKVLEGLAAPPVRWD
jgi:hypothetical protein